MNMREGLCAHQVLHTDHTRNYSRARARQTHRSCPLLATARETILVQFIVTNQTPPLKPLFHGGKLSRRTNCA